MMNLVSFMLTFLKVIWVYTGFEYKFSIINLPKNLHLTLSDLQEQLFNPVEEQNKNVELVEQTKELNRTEKHLTKNRLIYSIDTALDIDNYDKLP